MLDCSYGYSEQDRRLLADIDARLASLRPSAAAAAAASAVADPSSSFFLEPALEPSPAAEDQQERASSRSSAAAASVAGQPQNYLLAQVRCGAVAATISARLIYI